MISSIVFINQKGEILILRIYRDDITRAETMQFCTRIVARKESKESPIVQIDGASFIHITHKDIIILATTKSNINVAMTVHFLYQLVRVCKAYFGDFDENHIRKHFVLIYELLDEVMDYGLPQILDPEVLKQYIQEGGFKPELLNDIQKLKQLTNQATGAMSWRAEGIFHKKNEVYIDVIENVNVLMKSSDVILRLDVSGSVIVKSKLSGMPECKFGMNDKLYMQKEPKKVGQQTQDKGITIDDIKFHQCVKLPKFDKERAITFVPCDGVFEITDNINIPFKIKPLITDTNRRINASVNLKSLFDNTIFATNVALMLPCPKNTANVKCDTQIGRAKYEAENGGVMWRIKKFPGDFEGVLRCEIELSQTNSEKQWQRPPISMDFQVPMFTSSGLRVRFLRVNEKSGYKPTKWIRYVTKGGNYQVRI